MQIQIKLILLVLISVITYHIIDCQKVSEDLSKETVDEFDKELSEEEIVRLIEESVTESGEEETESGEEVIEEITGEPDKEFDDIDGEELLSGQTVPDVASDEDSDVILQAVKPKAKGVVSGRQIDPSVLKKLCGPNNNPNVVGMVQIHPDYVYVMIKETTGLQYYRLSGFAYDLNAITFAWNSIDWMGTKWASNSQTKKDLLNSISQWFRLRSTDGRHYIIGLSHQTIDDIDQMTAYKVEDNKNFFEDLVLQELNINLYKYNPGDDPDHLMSMFLKFPQDDLWNRLKAINDLPTSSQMPVPNRYFVYYLEKRPTNVKPKPGEPDTEFRRHIMKQEKVDYGDRTENDWIHDNASGRCIPQPEINGAITLTGYKMAKINGTYSSTDDTFDVLELIKDEYAVQRYQLNLNTLNIGVKQYEIKRGSIAELLGCVKPTPSPTTTTTIATTSTVTTPTATTPTVTTPTATTPTITTPTAASSLASSPTATTPTVTTPTATTPTVTTPTAASSLASSPTVTTPTVTTPTAASSLASSPTVTTPTVTTPTATTPTATSPTATTPTATSPTATTPTATTPTATTPTATTPTAAPPIASSPTATSPTTTSSTAAPISPITSPPIVSFPTTESTTIAPTVKSSSSKTWLWILLAILLIIGLIILCLVLYLYWLPFRSAVNFMLCLTPASDAGAVTATSAKPAPASGPSGSTA